MKPKYLPLLLLPFILFYSHLCYSQTFIMQKHPDNEVTTGLRYLRPRYGVDYPANLSTLAGDYEVYLNFPLSERINVLTSLPLTIKTSNGKEVESGPGNLYLGLEMRSESVSSLRSTFSFGVFLPTTSERITRATFIGLFANLYEPQKSLPNTLTLYANYGLQKFQSGKLFWGLELGPQLFIPTAGNGQTVELFSHYGLSGGFHSKKFAVWGELLGLVSITSDFLNFGQRVNHSFLLGGQLITKKFKPGVFLQVPIDGEPANVVDFIFGLKMEAVLVKQQVQNHDSRHK